MINHLVGQRYEVLEKIGEGPLFTVYKARDKSDEPRGRPEDRGGRIRAGRAVFAGIWNADLASAASLNHAGIARQFETGEYAPDAAERRRPPSMPSASSCARHQPQRAHPPHRAVYAESVAIDVACAVGEALQYAHNMGMAHGDLRPHNIIMSPEGGIKVTDFGVMTGVAAVAPRPGRSCWPRKRVPCARTVHDAARHTVRRHLRARRGIV